MSSATIDSPVASIRAPFPKKLRFLFTPSRYKSIRGGRGSAKSWGVARALLIKGTQKKLRMLCCREVQESIKDSVHKLLKDQIETMGLAAHYDVLRDEIRGANGTEFLFAGLSDLTIDSIKSFEGIDICWIEEAQSLTKNSWTILTPTIRKDGSEIWLTWNPQLDTDETYQRFVVNAPPDTISEVMNWRDNPFFPKVLDDERLHCQRTEKEEEYLHIWEGQLRTAIAGAIYSDEVAKMIREGRYAPCPYDPRLKVHTVWDLGYNDKMAIGLVQRARSEIRFIHYLEGSYKKTSEWATELNKLDYNWGFDWLPHDGFNEDRRGDSDEKILKAHGRKVKPKHEILTHVSVEAGIRQCRQMLSQTIMNRGGIGIDRLMEVVKRYVRHVPTKTGEPGAPVKNEYTHGADMLRYTALAVDKFTNEGEPRPLPRVQAVRQIDTGCGLLG